MSRHVRHLLDEYAAGELTPEAARSCDEHIAGCPSCRADLREIREARAVLHRGLTLPSEERDEEFWRAFASSVEARLGTPARRNPFADAAARMAAFIHANRRPLLAGSGALAAAALAAFFWLRIPAPGEPALAGGTGIADTAAAKLHDYLQRSKVLLIGVENARSAGGAPPDLSLERRQSRALVTEARLLRGEPLDARSARLVRELEKIMIQLSNTDERRDVEIVRTGVRQNNLLFKIRMTESVLESGSAERTIP